jgi:hypothetical protein
MDKKTERSLIATFFLIVVTAVATTVNAFATWKVHFEIVDLRRKVAAVENKQDMNNMPRTQKQPLQQNQQ